MSRILKHRIGEVEVIALTDGVARFSLEQFPDADPDRVTDLLAKAGKENIETNFNAFLIRSDKDCTLVDTGARDLFGPNAGFLMQALAEANVAASDINRVFISHMHPDHCAGAVTGDGQAVFADAELMLAVDEMDYWSNYSNFEGKGDMAEGGYRLAKTVFDAYQGRIRTTRDDADLGHGLQVVPLPGHTPGHCGIKATSEGDSFLFVGDIAHAIDLQIPDPDIAVIYDLDPVQAMQTRKKVLAMLADTGMACSGGHFLYPGIGRITRAGAAGYVFTALAR
jgi:glyoxylase-like metal-dependent hydrolase (beta-lactamase superfamily II)